MKPVKVGLLGLGTVGGGTVDVLKRNAEEITRRAGRGIQVTHASARDVNKERRFPMEGIELLADPFELVNHPEIDIIAELIGGTEPAFGLVMTAIDNGKHVVTANKALIAMHGNEIFEAAQKKGVIVAFEAAVAGGIPIIKAMREGLAGNRIDSVVGIINGTSNYILTAMREQERNYADVLLEAQTLGYAEADPTFDIEGIDAAHKLTILAAIAFGIPLQYDKVYTEGVTRITIDDVNFAERFGYRIKSLAIARRTDDGVEMRVHPTLIPEKRLIANVDGVHNAVLVTGDAVGDTIYYGAGAGAEPTASAVVADLVDIVRAMTSDPKNRVPHLAFQADALSDETILSMDDIYTAYYLRMQAVDEPGVLAEVTRVLGEAGISIEAILQREPLEGATHVPVILLTQRVQERYMNQAIRDLESLDVIDGEIMRIRMDPLD
ncbi:MAG TPA: homoserine dehydrogenase [Gammaproteobacteria bacterium]|nr:homoserine dehydrogenase [Gammaproteobacteria bacterium]